MKMGLRAAAIVIAVVAFCSGAALAQPAPKRGCDAVKAGAPQKVEGQVVSVDAKQGKVTVKTSDGKTQDFQASQETLREFKVGDKIEARLRNAVNC